MTLADSTRVKSPGWFSMSSHCTPISSMRTGMNDGIWNESPVAEPTEMKTPKPGRVWKVPSPRKAKFLAWPPSDSAPMRTEADTEMKETMTSVVPAAPVSSRKPTALSVTNVDSLISSVSTLSWKASTLPSVNVRAIRNASVSCVPSGLRSSVVTRSMSEAVKALPGKSRAPPVAM